VPKDEAIRETQRLGVAEADVTLDLDGWDAAYKAAILGHELLDLAVSPSDIEREGIGAVTDADARRATSESCRYRLVARGSRPRGLVRVAPERIPADSSFGVVRGLTMSVALRSRYAGQLEVSLVDPSLAQTAYALAMDLVELNAAVEGGDVRPPRGSSKSVHPVGPGWR
jgi:homoserine dehydrogenase